MLPLPFGFQIRREVSQNRGRRRGRRTALFWAGFGVLLVASLWLRVQRLDSYPWDYDEGTFLMFGRLIAAGYYPYSEAVISYLPPFPLTVALIWRLFGSVSAIRLTLTVLALAGVASLGLLARRLAGGPAGLICMALISFQPDFLQASRAVMADVPALSVATIAIASAWRYTETGRRWWLVGAMLALSLSLMTKFLVAYAIPVCLLLLAWRYVMPADGRTGVSAGRAVRLSRTLEDGVLALVALAAPVVVVGLVFDPQAMMAQAVGFRVLNQVTIVKGVARDDFIADLVQKVQMVGGFLWSDWGLLALAACGLVPVCLTDARRAWPVVAWLFLAGVSLLFDARLSQTHAVILLPPLALSAAVGLGYLWRSIRAGWTCRTRLVWQAASAMALVFYLAQLPAQVAALSAENNTVIEGRQDAVDFIRQVTFEDDCVITDEPAMALGADRLTPPELAETSEDLIGAGHLTEQGIIAVTEARDCPVVVFSKKKRFEELLPGYLPWVRDHYLFRHDFGHDDIFYLKRGVHVTRSAPLAEFGGQLRLWDYRLNLGRWKAGRGAQTPVRLYWQALQPVATGAYKLFVHLRNQQGETMAQADHFPFEEQLRVWPVGDILADSFRLDLPATMPAGEYTVAIGMYQPATGERLPVTPDASGEYAVILGVVRVEASTAP